MDRTGLVGMIDEALERFASREMVAGSEVVDLLLDLRTAVVSDAELQALIDSERQTTA
jgi:hypothetical protein